MHHVRIDLFTAARMLGQLPCADNLYSALPPIVAKLPSSVIRLCTEVSSHKTPTGIFKVIKAQACERWPGVGTEPIIGDRGSVIGIIVDGPSGEKRRVTWGGSAPSLERGMAFAEVALDRPNGKILSVKILPLEDRYALSFNGHSAAPDISKTQIAELQAATREARLLAAREAHTAPASVAPPAPQEVEKPGEMSPAQRRKLIADLLEAVGDGSTRHNGPIAVLSPLRWNDEDVAERMGVPHASVTMQRIDLGIQIMSTDEAANQIAAEVRQAIAATSLEATDTLAGLEAATQRLCQASSKMLELFKL